MGLIASRQTTYKREAHLFILHSSTRGVRNSSCLVAKKGPYLSPLIQVARTKLPCLGVAPSRVSTADSKGPVCDIIASAAEPTSRELCGIQQRVLKSPPKCQ